MPLAILVDGAIPPSTMIWAIHCSVRRRGLGGQTPPRSPGRCSIVFTAVASPRRMKPSNTQAGAEGYLPFASSSLALNELCCAPYAK